MSKIADVSVLLVAGGMGTRMQAVTPKQYLPLQGKPLILHSFDTFCQFPHVAEIIVICHPDYYSLFKLPLGSSMALHFASPGERRQDSVFNGLQMTDPAIPYVCVHDGVRPFVTEKMFTAALEAAKEYGAAAAAMPIKYTLKEVDENHFVRQTLERSRYWEIQTPQIIRKDLLLEGFEHAHRRQLTVTDDVSLVEWLSSPVKLVEGCYTNLKITTPEDLLIAEHLLSKR